MIAPASSLRHPNHSQSSEDAHIDNGGGGDNEFRYLNVDMYNIYWVIQENRLA